MQVHLCVIYLAAGLDKAMGRQWWNGEAIWQTVSQPAFSTFDLSWLARHSWIPMFAGWGTLVVEIGYVFLIWPRRTRKAWCIATIGLHLGTGLFMGLVFFSSVMILLTGCLFLIPEEVLERAVARAATAGAGGAPRGHLPAAARLGEREARARNAERSPTISRPWSAVSWHVTRFRAWPWESSSGDTSSSPAASVTAMWTITCRSRPTRSSLSGPARRRSRRRRSRCSRTREGSRSTLPYARTFPIFPSKTRWRRRP